MQQTVEQTYNIDK